MDSTTRASIVEDARRWLGTPYHHRGRILGAGVDCGGLLYEVYKPYYPKMPPPFPEGYAQDWALHKDNNEIYLDFLLPHVNQIKVPGIASIAVFKYGRSFSHGAIYCGNGEFIHAYGRTGDGAVISSHISFFNDLPYPRPVKYFDLKVD